MRMRMRMKDSLSLKLPVESSRQAGGRSSDVLLPGLQATIPSEIRLLVSSAFGKRGKQRKG